MPGPERSVRASEAAHSVGWCAGGAVAVAVAGAGPAAGPAQRSGPAVSQGWLR